jgi:hypothetical protein
VSSFSAKASIRELPSSVYKSPGRPQKVFYWQRPVGRKPDIDPPFAS